MNQADLKRLRDAIDADALGLGWQKMEPDVLAESLAAATVRRRRLVPIWEIQKLAIESGFLLAVESAAESHAVAEVQTAARVAVRYMNNPRFDNLDLDLVATETMLDALVTGGVLTAKQKAAIDALADVQVPFSEALGLGPILPGHVTKARAL
jgi:hypothetical protein